MVENKFKVSTINPDDLLNEVLVFDIECWSDYDIRTEFDQYVATAQTKWIGFYSYKSNKYYEMRVTPSNIETIKQFIKTHKVLVGFNSNSFDIPIVKNNGLMEGYKISLDLREMLNEKKRAILMGYKFKSYSLKNVAKQMGLETQKGDIDYTVFKKDSWSDEETVEIKKYLRADVECTKQIFEYMYNIFKPVTEFVDDKNIKNWSWLGCASGSLSYKVMCGVAGLPEEYGDYEETNEDGGGLVILPTAEEHHNVWYKDFTSLYPSIMNMLNIFGHPNLVQSENVFEGNNIFRIKGKYDMTKKHILTELYEFMFYQRKPLKKTDPHRAQTYKIILNGGYGVLRSKMFKSTYYEHAGSDICQVGRDLNILADAIYQKYGFVSVFGDTDSRGFVHTNKDLSNSQQLELMKLADAELYKTVNDAAPFPFDGFNFESETGDVPVVWMGFNYDKKKKVYKKKNYAFIIQDGDSHKVKLKGLPIIKDNATALGMKIFKEEIEPRMKCELHGKFDEFWVKSLIHDYVQKHWKDLRITYKVKPAKTYSQLGDLRAQISLKYLGGAGGSIDLYKNKKFGRVGAGAKYCTYEECIENNVSWSDLDLTKIQNELEPFSKGGFSSKIKTTQISGYF